MAKNVRESKKFKRLLAVLNGNEPAAVVAWNKAHPDRKIVDDAAVETLSNREQADVLVAKKGLVHTRGRVYTSIALIEAQVRVWKGGRPEVVPTDGEHRTKGVVVFRLDDGTVALQNLAEPS